jgi:hypothetical protein
MVLGRIRKMYPVAMIVNFEDNILQVILYVILNSCPIAKYVPHSGTIKLFPDKTKRGKAPHNEM